MGLQTTGNVDILKSIPIHVVDTVDVLDEHQDVPSEPHKDESGIIRSASFTALVGLARSVSQDGLKRTFSENILSSPAQQPTKISTSMQNANVELFRRASRKTRKRMSLMNRENDNERSDGGTKPAVDADDQSKSMARTVSGTIRNFARRTWMPTSRTESPTRKDEPPALLKKRSRSPKKQTTFSSTPIAMPPPVVCRVPSRSSPSPEESGVIEKPPRRSEPSPAPPKTRSLRDMHARNQSMTSVNRLSRQSSRTSLGSRSSADAVYLDVPSFKVPPLPNSASSDQLSGISVEINRRRDPLWAAFRSIEGEWSNFQSKTSLQKAKVIRTILLPFLSRYADDPSNQALKAEDLDHRIVILNKWWSGLLEILSGRSNQSISGTDRPAFLEAVVEIMLRPEWRSPPFQTRQETQNSRKADSIESDESDFIMETIHQNVRNIFVQNLLSQMAYVVDKLSMRSAPASLVTFSGKTCAYAFFFCPGVADILVRLWHIPAGILRRIFSEYGALHNNSSGPTPTEISQSFPPPVRSLSISSQSQLSRHIQPKAQRPAGSESIRWYGPWVNRWIGRDSDLFFIFVKHYHLLICEFHPNVLSQPDRLSLPGLAPVYAQILNVMESTLYRHVGHFTPETYTVGDTADALVPLPMSIPNATRSIAENRLVMLLRDAVSDTNIAHANVRTLLVESFELVTRAATKKISMYNSDAAFVLCDLIEETFPIMTRYEQLHDTTWTLDWSFWQKVLHQMVQSETCMAQIRVIALLYSIWPLVVANESRRRDWSTNWILKPTFFNQLFNHWSPMVRHYFYRFLCWRLGRIDGSATDLDLDILKTFASRLNTAWAHHQYLVAEAEMRTICPPSAIPCSPAPGRTLIIIRTDSQPVSSSPFTSFDKLLARDPNVPYAGALDPSLESDASPMNGKKRWSLFRSMNPFSSSPGNGRPGEVTPPGSPENSLEKRSGSSAANSAAPSRPGTPPHQTLSFKFSLEYVNNRPQMPAKVKKLLLPTLPSNAQKALDSLSTSARTSSESASTRTEIQPIKPKPDELNSARYSGRALAEWAQVVAECRNFYTRRKQEGCPRDSLVETPSMAVETFRMFA